MTNTIDFSKYTYVVNNVKEFDLTTAMRLWRTKYDDFKDFEKEVITHEQMIPFRDFVHEMWNDIKPVTVEEGLAQLNTERRRAYFDCIGVERLFKELDPTLMDRQVIKKKRTRWDDKNDPYEYEFEDVYELYEIPHDKMFSTVRWNSRQNSVYAVRCWCTTTNREYWLYVPMEAATGKTWLAIGEDANYDAIRAIAWTIRLDVGEPERIYRQGDIIVAKVKTEYDTVTPYHLNKDQYLSLMYSET